jgi:hypothetical protein
MAKGLFDRLEASHAQIHLLLATPNNIAIAFDDVSFLSAISLRVLK